MNTERKLGRTNISCINEKSLLEVAKLIVLMTWKKVICTSCCGCEPGLAKFGSLTHSSTHVKCGWPFFFPIRSIGQSTHDAYICKVDLCSCRGSRMLKYNHLYDNYCLSSTLKLSILCIVVEKLTCSNIQINESTAQWISPYSGADLKIILLWWGLCFERRFV